MTVEYLKTLIDLNFAAENLLDISTLILLDTKVTENEEEDIKKAIHTVNEIYSRIRVDKLKP